MNTTKRNQATRSTVAEIGSPKVYNEIIDFLNAHWTKHHTDASLTTMKKLNKALGNVAEKISAIFVTGTNGKSSTINFSAQLLKEEGLTVGAFYSPHILTYNERISINYESISNKTFTELGNEVLNALQSLNITASSREILTMMALLYFAKNNIDVALLEVAEDSVCDPVNICSPKILAITRITNDRITQDGPSIDDSIKSITAMVQNGTHVVSADQSKLSLQTILDSIKPIGGIWGMPIRKLAPLSYPFEQLHGRCAALAERIGQTYIDNFLGEDSVIVNNGLLAKEKGKRGRPTLEAKRQSEINPKRTIEQFWKETANTLPAHFQLLDKEKPSILLDTASNNDAFENLFLGIRLLHYQRPLKGITFIFGCSKDAIKLEEFLRNLRYFCKKNSAQTIFCPITGVVPGVYEESLDVEQITNDVKSLKIKARAAKNFVEAFEAAKKTVDERHGLVVITGSKSIISEYWELKGIKNFKS